MFDLNDCMAFITCRSAKIFADALERRMRAYEINRQQWNALYYIHTCSPLVQCELAEIMSLKEPTVARMLQKLENDGYLQKDESKGDHRKKVLSLSAQGEEIYSRMLPVAEKFKEDTISGISEEDLAILKGTLAKMVENAQKP